MAKTKLIAWDKASLITAANFILALEEGIRWNITIAKPTRKRTLDQNGLFHKWVGEVAEFQGNTFNQAKGDLKAAFAPKVRNEITGDERPMDTSEMTVEIMSEFMTQILSWAGPFGLYLTNPDDRGRN